MISMQTPRVEVLDAKGFRSDGRKRHELRNISITLGSQTEADGSAFLSHGLTQVAILVFGPREAKVRSQTLHDRSSINVEVNVASSSVGEWRKRSHSDRYIISM
jgi:exosome complex component RRP41